MKKENLQRMTAAELDEYAKALGIARLAGKTAEDKARLIEERRGRSATVRAIGLDLVVPIKRLHDKRVADMLFGPGADDASYEQAARAVLGEEQFALLVDACTDEDGTVDVEAMGVAVAKVLGSKELKNF